MEENKLVRPSLDEFKAPSYDEWKAEAIESLKGGDFDKKLLTKTYEGITLKPIYTKADFAGDEELPGYGDYIRGTDAAGYRNGAWAVAQEIKAECVKCANEKILRELSRGGTGVNVNIARCGLGVNTAEDMKTLFSGVDFEKAALQIRSGACALEKLKLACESLPGFAKAHGCFYADPIGSLAKNGRLTQAPEALLDDMAATAKYAKSNVPGLRTAVADANVYANGGANAVDEAAFAIATVSDYISAMMERGLTADEACSSVAVAVSLGSNFFMEIAKLRAMRAVFAKIARAYGANDEAAKLYIFARTSAFNKTVFDPYVNILRTTTEAFSGVVGGVNGMAVSPLDEAIGKSDETTERIARNVQIMLREEFDLLRPADPVGGSWYVETLTRELAEAIVKKFRAVDAEGGMIEYLKAGKAQSDIKKVLDERFKKLATRADRAVGTNMYANMTEVLLTREQYKSACANTAPAMLTVEPVEAHRLTEQFEAVRLATDENAKATGKRISVFSCNMGSIPQHKARADFSRGFFEVGGFIVIGNDGFATVEEASDAASKSGADVAVICSTDDTYPELVPALARAIKAKAPGMTVMLAGAPAPEFKASYDEAGVDDYVHVRANCIAILKNIQAKRGIEK